MIECPECGVEQDTYGESCSNCHHRFRLDDVRDYEPHEIAFTVKFQCQNCHRQFKEPFGKGDEVFPRGSRKPNFAGVNRVTGNRFKARIGSQPCVPQCPTCDSDGTLYVLERIPVRER